MKLNAVLSRKLGLLLLGMPWGIGAPCGSALVIRILLSRVDSGLHMSML